MSVDTNLPRPLPAERGAAAWGQGGVQTSLAYPGVSVSRFSVHCRENPRARDASSEEHRDQQDP